ncbi:MAG: hypothetical protein M3O92_00335 [Actinomycetota bacterium]|nr:hypothetical protein [Actinomycetota bacterium]
MIDMRPCVDDAAYERKVKKWNAAQPKANNSIEAVRARIEELSAPFEATHSRDRLGRFTRKRRLRAVA